MGMIEVSRSSTGMMTLLLRNEARRNALDDPMFAALTEAIEGATASKTRLIVIRGAGGTFCAGRDVSELAVPDANATGEADPIKPVERLARAMRDRAVPVVAAVEGKAIGLGVALVAWCDLALATADATFAVPEARIGVPPSITAVSLQAAIGRRATMSMILTGRPIAASAAQEIGLVQDVRQPGPGFAETLAAVCSDILRGSPAALSRSLHLLAQTEGLGRASAILSACELARANAGHPEQVEGLAAFRERRSPSWA